MPPEPPRPARPAGPPPYVSGGGSTFAGRPIAGFGYRVAAYLFDSGLALACGVLAFALSGDEDVLIPTAIAVWLLATTVATAFLDGQSLGKRFAGIRVLCQGGTPAGFGTSLLRDQLARLLYLVPLFFIADSIWAAASREGQTLRDKMVSTYVVRDGGSTGRAWAVAGVATALLGVWVGGTSVLDDGSGGAGAEGYTDSDRRVFVDSCAEEGSPRADCECLFEFIADRVPYEEFASVRSDDPNDWPRRVQDATSAGVARCVS